LYFTLYLTCIFVQLINSHQQMHQNKFVTDFFILLIKKSVTNLFWCICWCELINCLFVPATCPTHLTVLCFIAIVLHGETATYVHCLQTNAMHFTFTFIIHSSTPTYVSVFIRPSSLHSATRDTHNINRTQLLK
jgi:hypothetical protein